jgi:hypothetical protein
VVVLVVFLAPVQQMGPLVVNQYFQALLRLAVAVAAKTIQTV